jgi:hypothetical protein
LISCWQQGRIKVEDKKAAVVSSKGSARRKMVDLKGCLFEDMKED